MERHQIATQSEGVSKLTDMCTLLAVHVDPVSTYLEYSESPGVDLTGTPIEAGLPRATWTWSVMSQADFEILRGYQGDVYIHTRQNSGTSGYDFDTFTAVMSRPTAASRDGLLVHNVTCEFLALVAV